MTTRKLAKGTRCSKPAGEYCRLHNPAPATRSFNTINEVFAVLDAETTKHPAFLKPARPEPTFQDVTVTRTLPQGIPLNLTEHVSQNEKELSHLTDEQRKAVRGYTGFAAGVCNTVLLNKEYEYYLMAPPSWKETDSGPCDFRDREDLVDYMETIDDILAPRQEQRRIVYRGIPIYKTLHDEIMASIGRKADVRDTEGLIEGLNEYYKPGKVFNHPTYLSTTHSAHYAAERSDNTIGTYITYYDKPEISGIVFEMKTNAGLDVTSAAQRNAYEREVVLPRDTHFKVVNVYTRPEKYDTIGGYDRIRRPEELSESTYDSLAVVVQMVEVDAQGNEITHINPHKPVPSIESIIPQ